MKNIFYLAAFSSMTLFGMHPAPAPVTLAEFQLFKTNLAIYKQDLSTFLNCKFQLKQAQRQTPQQPVLIQQLQTQKDQARTNLAASIAICQTLKDAILDKNRNSSVLKPTEKHMITKTNIE